MGQKQSLPLLTDSWDRLPTEVTGIWGDCLCLVPGRRHFGLWTNIENTLGLKTFNFKYFRIGLAKYLKCPLFLSVWLTEMTLVLSAGWFLGPAWEEFPWWIHIAVWGDYPYLGALRHPVKLWAGGGCSVGAGHLVVHSVSQGCHSYFIVSLFWKEVGFVVHREKWLVLECRGSLGTSKATQLSKEKVYLSSTVLSL